MKIFISLKILFLSLLATFKLSAQTINTKEPLQSRNGYGWYVIYRSTDGISGNSLYFGGLGSGEKITSSPSGAPYGPPHGLNFITRSIIRMAIYNHGLVRIYDGLEVFKTVKINDRLTVAELATMTNGLDVHNKTTIYGELNATNQPVKIQRLHIDPKDSSDGYNNGGIFFGGKNYSYDSDTGISSNRAGSYGPKNGLNFWTNNKLAMAIDSNGTVGIGVDPSQMGSKSEADYRLFVKGAIKASNIKICNIQKWPDYVFEKDYNLISLAKLEEFINTNKHLPNMPTAKQIKDDNNSINVSDIITSLLKTIEEQTLYIVNINKRLEKLENQKLDNLKND